MRINSVNSYNTNPYTAFGSQNKNKSNNSMTKAAKAMMLATAISGVAGSCDKLSYNVEHNHYFEIPTDTFTKTELVPTPVPPQIIYIETEVPGKADTIFVPQPPDTLIVEKPGKTDTIFVPQPPDTIVVEKPGKTDTIFVPQPPDTIVVEKPGKPDTIFVPQPPDTVIIEKPPVVKWDTLYLPGDTIFIKENWKSPIPPKQEELYDELGITPTGNGKFFISMAYYDRKNNCAVQRLLDGQKSSRDGSILVYNVIKTKWDNAAEGVVLGKNETFEKQIVFLSDDGNQLGMKIMVPTTTVNVSNNNNKSNWDVFETGKLSSPGSWKDSESFFATTGSGIVQLSNGFTLKPGRTDKSVTTINPYNSEWELIDWSVIKGDAD